MLIEYRIKSIVQQLTVNCYTRGQKTKKQKVIYTSPLKKKRKEKKPLITVNNTGITGNLLTTINKRYFFKPFYHNNKYALYGKIGCKVFRNNQTKVEEKR